MQGTVPQGLSQVSVPGCCNHSPHGKGIDQAQDPFRGSHQEQKETRPDTRLETQLQCGLKSCPTRRWGGRLVPYDVGQAKTKGPGLS